MGRIDETKIIDREAETAAFLSLVRLEVQHRVMLVTAKQGMGKTDLLRKFRLIADRDHQVPVAFVSFADFENLQDEFAIVQHLSRSLSQRGMTLPSFQSLNSAREQKNKLPFLELIRDHQGRVDLTGAVVEGAPRIAALMINTSSFTMPEWDQEADGQARWVCVQAFLSDLTTFCADRAVVLLLDGLEKVGDDLRNWLIAEFVRRRALSTDGAKLVVVVSGTDAQDMVLGRLSASEQACVLPLPPFAVWTEAEVRRCMINNGIAALVDEEIQAATLLLQAGRDLMWVITQAQQWARDHAGGD